MTTATAGTGNPTIDGCFAIDQAFRAIRPLPAVGDIAGGNGAVTDVVTVADHGTVKILRVASRSPREHGWRSAEYGIYVQHSGGWEKIATLESDGEHCRMWTTWKVPVLSIPFPDRADTDDEARASIVECAAEIMSRLASLEGSDDRQT